MTPSYKHRVKLQHIKQNWAPKELVDIVKNRGDDQFISPVTCDEVQHLLPPLPNGFFYSEHSGVLLKLRNVSPHFDDAVGRLVGNWRGSMFALLSNAGECYLHVGEDHCKLEKGDWVIFDDAILHSLQAEKQVLGMSIQIGNAPFDVELD